mmetsp:Transcript_40901/g.105815  ORF Transcript_40901/g.105815 Transcript_40901/m.105815 type:complete len:83 (+) Transcript_40901:372-620(+)
MRGAATARCATAGEAMTLRCTMVGETLLRGPRGDGLLQSLEVCRGLADGCVPPKGSDLLPAAGWRTTLWRTAGEERMDTMLL